MIPEEPVLLSPKLSRTASGYQHWCPGCQVHHEYFVDQPAPGGASWSFNGNVHMPSFQPSMHITYGPWVDDEDPSIVIPKTTRCHYFLTDGVTQFLGDCEHDLKGMRMNLPDLPGWKW
jgi:hypothetical protein